jgi:DNA invertase Pin-like site-specific DNA recombinase
VIPIPSCCTCTRRLPRKSGELIRARTGEGRKRAQARGVKFGRPSKLNAHQRKEAIARMRNGETQADIARTYGVDATTIGRLDCAPL